MSITHEPMSETRQQIRLQASFSRLEEYPLPQIGVHLDDDELAAKVSAIAEGFHKNNQTIHDFNSQREEFVANGVRTIPSSAEIQRLRDQKRKIEFETLASIGNYSRNCWRFRIRLFPTRMRA